MVDKSLLILLPGHQLFGQEQALIGIAQVLRTRGFSPHFLLHKKWGQIIATHVELKGFEYTLLPMGTLWSINLILRDPIILFGNIWSVIRTSLIFLKLTNKKYYSSIILGNSTFSLYLLPALFLSKITVIYRHGDDLPAHSIFHRIMTRLLLRRVNRHTANCKYLKDRLVTRFPDIDPIVIYNTPWKEISLKSNSMMLNDDKSLVRKHVVYIGQLSEKKGILLLLQAFRILAPSHPDLFIDLVGEVPGVGNCKVDEITATLQQTMIEFPNRLRQHGFQNDVSQFYHNANIHVCPSILSEASPNVILEAKQYGLPSVVFNIGGMPELVVHKKDGFICKHISATDLAVGIEYFLNDDDVCVKAGIVARQSIEKKFSKQFLSKHWHELLTKN